MKAYLPLILVALAVFSAGCVAFVAWALTKEALRDGEPDDDKER